jgi:C1A family cysteine protease
LLGVAVASAHLYSESEYQFLFSKWIAQHNKKYNHENFFYRYTVFKRNMDFITVHNKGKHSYTLGMNAFGDLTPEEFKATYASGYNRIDRSYARSKNAPAPTPRPHKAPSSLDWRTQGAVTPVKNQQQCGSCWAFSAIGALEGANFIQNSGKLVSFSEQQLVDCSGKQGNQGCNGGLMDQAFQYLTKGTAPGVCTEQQYAYKAVDGTCTESKCAGGSQYLITAYKDVPQGDETQTGLLGAVDQQPVSIAIEADQQVFQFYSGGVLTDPSCGTQLDHGVLVVGWGTDSGQDYWIVKNSWGDSWGEQGYIRLGRGINECGLATEPSYPSYKS